MKFRRRIFYPLLLAFSLLFAQMGGLAHGISHIITGQSQGSDHALSHNKYCGQCAAYGQIGSAIGSNTIYFASSENFETLHFDNPVSCTSNTFVAFAARSVS